MEMCESTWAIQTYINCGTTYILKKSIDINSKRSLQFYHIVCVIVKSIQAYAVDFDWRLLGIQGLMNSHWCY